MRPWVAEEGVTAREKEREFVFWGECNRGVGNFFRGFREGTVLTFCFEFMA